MTQEPTNEYVLLHVNMLTITMLRTDSLIQCAKMACAFALSVGFHELRRDRPLLSPKRVTTYTRTSSRAVVPGSTKKSSNRKEFRRRPVTGSERRASCLPASTPPQRGQFHHDAEELVGHELRRLQKRFGPHWLQFRMRSLNLRL